MITTSIFMHKIEKKKTWWWIGIPYALLSTTRQLHQASQVVEENTTTMHLIKVCSEFERSRLKRCVSVLLSAVRILLARLPLMSLNKIVNKTCFHCVSCCINLYNCVTPFTWIPRKENLWQNWGKKLERIY